MSTACDLSFRLFFPTILMAISTKGNNCFNLFDNFYGTYKRGLVFIDTNNACDLLFYCVFN